LRRLRVSAVPHARVTRYETDRRELAKRPLTIWRKARSLLEIAFRDSERFRIVNRLA
jgi:hypothetical protein